MFFPFLHFFPSGYHGVFGIHTLSSYVQHVCHRLWVVLVNKEEEFSGAKSISEGCDQHLIIYFVDQKGFLVESSLIRSQALIFLLLDV